MIDKKITYDHNITEEGLIQVRRITRLMEDNIELSKTYHRHVIDPKADDITNEDARTRMLCSLTLDSEDLNELNEINAQIKDGSIVSEGEDAATEAVKLEDAIEKKAGFWSRLFRDTYNPETRI